MQSKDKEVLSIGQEECAEVIQIISKIFRFGFDAKHPEQVMNNRERLEEEVGDLRCMINLMISRGIIREEYVTQAENKKFEKLHKWSNIFKD
jgi:hypothetical protein